MIGFQDRRLDELEALYRSRFPHFVRVAIAITGDEERALDAVQDAFASAVRSRRSYRGEGPLEAWVWRAVVNAARKSVTRRPHVEEQQAGVSENGWHPPESELLRAIALLPERQRLALFLRYYVDLDYRSIAQALDVEVGTVSATLSAAHTFLRRALKEVRR